MNNLDEQYKGLLGTVLYGGVDKTDRTGTGTRSVFGRQIRHDMSKGFPILTTKKVAFNTMVTELKWFLKGDTNIRYLVDRGCNIWNGDAYKRYTTYFDNLGEGVPLTQKQFIEQIIFDDEFAEEWGQLGPIYGKQWRNKSRYGIQKDQIKDLINGIKKDPNSRRLIVNSWDVFDIDQMVLPPCHVLFQVYVVNGKLSLMWYQRSADLFLGVPFNISSYGLLLLLLCKETGYEPGELIGNFGDVHLYKNHLEQAKEQINREPYKLPTIKLSNVNILQGEFDIELEDYISHPTIKAPLNN
ncbi:thymidylate synthase [bacterium]|nr:thymidylate synthase [bacterium]